MSKRVAVVCCACFVALFYGLPLYVVQYGQDLCNTAARGAIEKLSSTALAAQGSDEGEYFPINTGVATVNLPPGEKFIQFVPSNSANTSQGSWNHYDNFITERRLPSEKPRLLAFYGPGRSFHSWEVKLYIREH